MSERVSIETIEAIRQATNQVSLDGPHKDCVAVNLVLLAAYDALREALTFYADEKNWQLKNNWIGTLHGPDRARQALEAHDGAGCPVCGSLNPCMHKVPKQEAPDAGRKDRK